MLISAFGLLAILSLLQAITFISGSSCMYYQFETQPSLALTCDPYSRIQNSDRIVWRLRFECEVSRLSSSAGSFDVHWFRRDPNTQNVTDLGRVQTVQSEPDELEIRYGEYLVNKDFTDSMLGDYWCQVINTTTQPHTYLGMSNVLTILHPDQYNLSLPDCALVENEEVTCVDIPVLIQTIVPLSSSESHITMTTPVYSTNHHQVPTLTTSSVHVSVDHITHSTVQPILITTSTVPTTTLPPILLPSNTNMLSTDTLPPILLPSTMPSPSTLPIIPVSMMITQTVLPPILPVSMTTMQTVLSNKSTINIQLQSSSTNPLNYSMTGTNPSSDVLLLHISHSVIHLLLLLIVIILIAIMCLRKRLAKVVQKLPIYVEVLEATPDTMKTRSSKPATVCPIELQTNEAYNTVQSNTEAEYTPLDANTMQPNIEYAVVKID